jgi:hypothetical protein
MFKKLLQIFAIEKLFRTYPDEIISDDAGSYSDLKSVDDLSKMTKQEIVSYASELGVELNVKNKKSDLINACSNSGICN